MKMSGFSDIIRSADWKSEKHAPVIECADQVMAGAYFDVTVSVGKEIPHPNTTEHFIGWITLYFVPEGQKLAYQIAHFEFKAHGESGAGPNQGPVYTEPISIARMKTDKPGTLRALAFCNIHGLWEGSKEITLA
jgi:superoxide reductase